MLESYRNDTNEKVTATRLGWHMVRLVSRRATFAVQQTAAIIGYYFAGKFVQYIDFNDKYEGPGMPFSFPEQAADDPRLPNSVGAYLQRLATELETAETDENDL